VAVLLGVIVALSFGSADFLGGRASKQANTVAVLFLGTLVAVGGALAVAALVDAEVARADIGYGGAAGAVNVVGLGLLYYGLAHFRVGVVAPLTAVMGALVPAAWGVVRGERPSALVFVGAALAIVAAGLIAREAEEHAEDPNRTRSIVLALAAGTMLGTSLILYAETSEDSGMWPVFAGRLAGLVLVTIALLALLARASVTFPRGGARGFALATGALDVTATALLLVAVRRGLLVVVAPLASLAPAFTVVFAFVFLHERIARVQLAGLLLGALGLVLVAAG
jgi:drug/metabolite transporter (DMT)-like permease